MSSFPLTQSEAWQAYEDLLVDPRIDFIGEPPSAQSVFYRISNRNEVSPKRWQDDYLLAFAEAANLTFITFDRALAARAPSSILLTP